VRYRFHTRNHEVAPLLRALARARPTLVFRLTTLCLDDSSIESHLMIGRKASRWVLPDRRRDFHWDRARAKFTLAGEDVYEDDEADSWHEQEMLADAVSHWDHLGRVRRAGPLPPYEWWNQMIWRDLQTERRVLLAEFLEREKAEQAASPKGGRSTRKRKRT
jgi:hypothetical protein